MTAWLRQLVVWCVVVRCGGRGAVRAEHAPVVETQQGRLRGLRGVSGQNRYYGIPYAVAKRFQPPEEPPPWSGLLDAVDRFRSCPQMFFSLVVGTEECLVLDVYSPARARPPDRLPVMVFIHGGAYYYGTKAHYDPEYLVVKNVIVVVINYRLNVLGFLCVNGVSNLGLKDQVAALKWVQKNIAAFGGDPDNVTLCGQSAGASAATMHLMSEASRGLFHKVIAMSGSAFAPWAFNLDPLSPAMADARKLAPARTEHDIYKVFLNSPTDDLIRATRDTSVDPKYFKYSPCMDSNATAPFFHDTPYNIFKRGELAKVPMMLGRAEDEGILFYGLTEREILTKLDEQFDDRLPSVFSWCSENRRIVGASLRSHYFGTGNITKDSTKGLVKFYSDWIVQSTHDEFVKLLTTVSHEPVYDYVFSYEGNRNFAKLISGVRAGGTTHSDDVFYMFKPAGLPLPLAPQDEVFIHRWTLMVTNFMKFGDPTPAASGPPPRWPPAGATRYYSLRLAARPAVVTGRRAGGLFLRLLCTYGHPGHVPCASAALCAPPAPTVM